jgi:hypothetical protein
VLRSGWLKPFFVWLFTTVLVPFVISKFVVLPPPHEGRTRRASHTIEPASPITFSIVRLAFDIYFTKIAPQSSLRWSWDIVNRFGDLQLVAAGAAFAFALAELVSSRK